MPTDRQIAANRNNAGKSTGPRSKEGKQASRRNALRHGLAINIRDDPAFDNDVGILARALSRGQKVSEFAREAAEAQLDLMRIRKLRAWLFEKLDSKNAGSPEGLAELNDKLSRLARYDRRAFSRRKRALRAL